MDPDDVETNMVFADVSSLGLDPMDAIELLGREGLGVTPIGPGVLRMVTHVDVDDAGIDLALGAWRAVVAST